MVMGLLSTGYGILPSHVILPSLEHCQGNSPDTSERRKFLTRREETEMAAKRIVDVLREDFNVLFDGLLHILVIELLCVIYSSYFNHIHKQLCLHHLSKERKPSKIW